MVGFNVRPNKLAKDQAEREDVERTYRVIYDCINEIEAAMRHAGRPLRVIDGHLEVEYKVSDWLICNIYCRTANQSNNQNLERRYSHTQKENSPR